MSTTEQDIIIVGGGISGAALAYGLSGKGRKVTVLDAPTDTNKASRTNVGLIWCQSKFLHLPEYAIVFVLAIACSVLCFVCVALACYFLVDWDFTGYVFWMELIGVLLTVLIGWVLYRTGKKQK